MKIEIHLFGEFELRLATEPVLLKGAKPQALLAFLAASGDRAHPRDRLTGMFWGDHAESNARTNLRQALTTIRRALPEDALQTEGDSVRLATNDLWVDALEFDRLRQADSAQDRLRAANVYDGELLDGFRSKAPAFEDWLALERESYRRHAYELLNGLLGSDEVRDEPEQVVDICSRLLAIDATNEQIHRELMQVYGGTDRMGLALHQFKMCEEALRRELGTVPSVATVELLRRLKAGTVAAPKAELPSISNPDKTPVPLKLADSGDRSPRLPSIAVLPFESMSEAAEHGYLADGMTDELINMLANCVNWRVIARIASFKYKHKQVEVGDLGTDLGADYVVEGSILRAGDRIRVRAQLVNTSEGTQIWSDRYDRQVDEIFDVQDEVVHAIFRVLRNRIGFAERERVRRTPTANLDAWGLLVKAGQVKVTDAKSREEQRALIREALAIDPAYPRAHALMASVVFTSVGRGLTKDANADLKLGHNHCEAALENGNTDISVLKMCAGGLAAVGNAQRALELAERVYSLARSPDALLVAVLMWNGRLAEAQQHCEDMVNHLPPGLPTSPGELRPVALLGNLHMLQGNLTQALDYARQDVSANPDNYFSYVNLANVHGLLGEEAQAQEHWVKAKELVPRLTRDFFALGYRRVMVTEALAQRFVEGLEMAGIE